MTLSAEDRLRQADGTGGRAAVLAFVRTPFAVRRNVVKVWRSLPRGIWTLLAAPADRIESIRREKRAMAGVAVMALALVVLFSGVGFRQDSGGTQVCFPLLGRAIVESAGVPEAEGWTYVPGQSLALALWVVVPSLGGWALVRLIWIPTVAAGRSTQEATVTFARYLGSVYLYVYLMIVVGAALMPLLILASPAGTETFRWYLWCFLFGESFFVPAVMWLRLVIDDTSGVVFGRLRYAMVGLYLMLFVVIPIAGMVRMLD